MPGDRAKIIIAQRGAAEAKLTSCPNLPRMTVSKKCRVGLHRFHRADDTVIRHQSRAILLELGLLFPNARRKRELAIDGS